MNLALIDTDARGIGCGLDFALGFDLGCGLGLALGIANYLNRFGWHGQMGRSSKSSLALALEPTSKKKT